MSQIILEVPDISCDHCVHTVTQALQGEPGVQGVQVDLPGKLVQLDYDEATLDLAHIRAVLDEEGYPVAGTHAPDPNAKKRTMIPLTGK
jgi:copper chaperone CopZ